MLGTEDAGIDASIDVLKGLASLRASHGKPDHPAAGVQRD